MDLSSAVIAHLAANPLDAPVHPDKDPSSWLALLRLLSQQKAPSSLDAAKGVAGSLGWPHTVAHVLQPRWSSSASQETPHPGCNPEALPEAIIPLLS